MDIQAKAKHRNQQQWHIQWVGQNWALIHCELQIAADPNSVQYQSSFFGVSNAVYRIPNNDWFHKWYWVYPMLGIHAIMIGYVSYQTMSHPYISINQISMTQMVGLWQWVYHLRSFCSFFGLHLSWVGLEPSLVVMLLVSLMKILSAT